MKTYLIFFLLILTSCTVKKIDSIVVSEQGLKFYLDKNIVKVCRTNGEESISFFLSKADYNDIKNIYLKNELYNLPDNVFYNSKQNPKRIITISVEINNKRKEITFQDESFDNQLKGIPNIKVRAFFKYTLKIIQEIKNKTKVRTDCGSL